MWDQRGSPSPCGPGLPDRQFASVNPHFLGHGLFSLNYSLIFIASGCARLGRPQNWAQKVKPEADVVTVNRTRLEIDSSIKPTCITLVTKRMNLPLSEYNERRRIFLFSCCPLAQSLKPMHKAREAPSTQPRVEISKEPVAPLQIPSSGMTVTPTFHLITLLRTDWERKKEGQPELRK